MVKQVRMTDKTPSMIDAQHNQLNIQSQIKQSSTFVAHRRALTGVGALLAAERLAVDSFRTEVRIFADERRA